jgi:hypothetical protein
MAVSRARTSDDDCERFFTHDDAVRFTPVSGSEPPLRRRRGGRG